MLLGFGSDPLITCTGIMLRDQLCCAFSSLFVFLPCFCSCKDLYLLPQFSLSFLLFLPFLFDNNGKVLVTHERPEVTASSLSRDIP